MPATEEQVVLWRCRGLTGDGEEQQQRSESAGMRRHRSDPRSRVSSRRPGGAQVLSHIERARDPVARDLAREAESERVAMLFGVHASDPHGLAMNRSGEI